MPAWNHARAGGSKRLGADFEAGVWMGGSEPGDPGWGERGTSAPSNTNNPSMAGVDLCSCATFDR
jgi:hypothetical protein